MPDVISVTFAILAFAEVERGWYACPSADAPSRCTSRAAASCMPGEQALAIASSEARRLGIDLADYRAPRADYGCGDGRCSWSVHFPGRSLAIGHFFGVDVDDATCASTLDPGL